MTSYWDVIIPEAATNLVTNPSFETGTTIWAAVDGGTNSTVATRVSTYQRRGVYSVELAFDCDGANPSFYWTDELAATAGNSYTFSLDVNVPGTIGTGTYYIRMWWYAAGSTEISSTTGTTTTTTGGWNKLSVTGTAPATTVAVRCGIVFGGGASTSDFTIYIDGAQLENAAYATTYLDGDQDGCRWTGVAHASTSKRDAQSRAGGRIYDLSSYGFYVTELSGVGMATIQSIEQAYALLPGSEYSGYKVQPRSFALIGEVIGSARYDLHGKRQDLIDAMRPDKVTEAEPFTLRYRGANVDSEPIEIRCVYGGGLEFGGLEGYSEKVGIRLIAYDPFWYDEGNDATVLDTNDSATVYYVAMRSGETGQWSAMGCTAVPTASTSPIVRTILADPYNPDLVYIGGDFEGWDAIAGLHRVAKYSIGGDSWSVLGGSSDLADGIVYDMVAHPNGTLYIGGSFDSVNGSTNPARFAKLASTSSNWEAVVSGTGTGTVNAMAVDKSGNIYLAGSFEDWGGVAADDYVIKYNGDTFVSYKGTLTSTNVPDIIVGVNDDVPYIVNDINTAGLWRWSNSSSDWELLYGSTDVDEARRLTQADNGDIYIATTYGLTDNIKVWKGGGGFVALSDTYIITYGNLYYDDDDDLLYCASEPVNLITRGMMIYNGSVFVQADIQLPSSDVNVHAITKTLGGDLVIGFNQTGTANFSGATTVTNEGSERAYPLIKFKRSGGTYAHLVYLENFTTKKKMYFDYYLNDGETLIIDCRLGKRSITSSYYGNRYSALMRGSDFSDFYLQPGTNTILAFIDESGTPTITATMEWKTPHWSIDGGST